MTPVEKARLVKSLGRRLGLDLVGLTAVRPSRRDEYYRDWLARGYAGSMAFLARNVRLRLDPARLLPGAKTVICGAVNYRREDGYIGPAGASATRSGAGRVAQYARGHDYHVVLRRMLEALLANLRRELDEPFDARVFVDTGPLLERELAANAGLGWIGKNTCLLNGRWGSYLLLGEILTTLELPPDEAVTERCARCTRCITACPTGALRGPRQLDASRCIAYLTIEHRAEIPAALRSAIGDRLFGCDVCQQVCPYNARAPRGRQPEINSERLPAQLDLRSLIDLPAGEYRRLTRGTAGTRAGRAIWVRNAAICLENSGAGARSGSAAEVISDPAP